MASAMAGFDEKADEIPAGGGGGGKDLKSLPDGEYVFDITSAYERASKTGSVYFKMELEAHVADSTTKTVEHTYFLTKDGTINEVSFGILKKDLKSLGFDVDNWTRANGRPFSGEFEKAVFLMIGMSFKGKKSTNKGGYAQLYVNERTVDGKPNPVTLEALAEVAKAKADPFEA